jgi:hypothetical protein
MISKLILASLRCKEIGNQKLAKSFMDEAVNSPDYDEFVKSHEFMSLLELLQMNVPESNEENVEFKPLLGPRCGSPSEELPRYREDDPEFRTLQPSTDYYNGQGYISPLRPAMKEEEVIEPVIPRSVKLVITIEQDLDRKKILDTVQKYLDKVLNFEVVGDKFFIDTDHQTGATINSELSKVPMMNLSSDGLLHKLNIKPNSKTQLLDLASKLSSFSFSVDTIKQNISISGSLEDCMKARHVVNSCGCNENEVEETVDMEDLGGEDLYI